MNATQTKPAPILYVNAAPLVGGAEASLLDLMRHLDRTRFAPRLAAPPGPLAEAAQKLGIEVCILPLRRLKRKEPLSLARFAAAWGGVTVRLARLARRAGVRLVHANGTTACLYGFPAARLARVPCVWHVRDLVPLGGLGRFLSRNADRIIAISNAVANDIRQYGAVAGRIVVIHNGIDTESFRPDEKRQAAAAIRREMGMQTDGICIGMAAQRVPWKGHPLFIRAAAQVAARFPEAVFVVAGDDRLGDHPGYGQTLVELASRLGIRNRLVFAGHRADMKEFLSALDILVHPAAREPFGRVLVEAMALEKPVVAVRDAGPAEIVVDGETGLLVPPDDPEAMACAILRLTTDRDLGQRMGQSGRMRAESLFDIRVTAERIQALYEEILGRPS